MSMSIVLIFENANVLFYFFGWQKNSTINYIERKKDKKHTSCNSFASFLLVFQINRLFDM